MKNGANGQWENDTPERTGF